MAEEDEAATEEPSGDESGEESEGRARSRLSGRTLVLFVILTAVLLAGGAGVYFSGLLGGAEETSSEIAAKPKVFYELPEMLVNLADHGEERARYLKLQASLELPDEEARSALEPVLPRVIDLFQVYLRELRSSDLDGSAGIYRLKEELVRRVNLEIQPREVSDVLFREIIVQ